VVMGRIRWTCCRTSATRKLFSIRVWDRSPDIIEDQVTFPIVTAMLGTPKVKDVRGFSDFGYSYVYVIFEDNTDLTGRVREPWNPCRKFLLGFLRR